MHQVVCARSVQVFFSSLHHCFKIGYEIQELDLIGPMAGDVNIFLTSPGGEDGNEDILAQDMLHNGHTSSADMDCGDEQHHQLQSRSRNPEGVDNLQGANVPQCAHVAEVEVMVAGKLQLEGPWLIVLGTSTSHCRTWCQC